MTTLVRSTLRHALLALLQGQGLLPLEQMLLSTAFNPVAPHKPEITLRPGSIAQIPEQTLNPDAHCPFLCIHTCPQPPVVSNLVNILEKKQVCFF